jgi:hypothetical protein
MNLDDDRFERHLRSFNPRIPGPLNLPLKRAVPDFAKFAIACALVLAAILIFLHAPRKAPAVLGNAATESQLFSVRQLTLAAENGNLERALSTSAIRSLPRTDQPHSALNTLAKD